VPADHPEARGSATTRGPPAARLYRYVLGDGWIVLAGRTDEDNDRLSLSLARPDDWWFHVRGMPGSHVVLQARPGEEPPREVLRQAAAVAAYHSKARAGGVVAVSYTRARFVSKPRGAKPGTVEIRREEVLKVRPALPDEERGP
jgi:predicted ribosome quality control (RQC) complex YloA/Tae2 family protein